MFTLNKLIRMEGKVLKERKVINKSYIFPLLLLAIVVLSSSIYSVGAKYAHPETLKSTIVISTKLVDKISFFENEAVLQPDGSYILNNNKVNENSYTVMPGVDIPKNPQFLIEEKSGFPSFLMLEVVENVPSSISYSLIENWMPINIVGPNGGAIYAYSSDGISPLVLDESFSLGRVSVLTNDMIYVSDTAKAGDVFDIDFYGYLVQQIEDNSAADSFTNIYG